MKLFKFLKNNKRKPQSFLIPCTTQWKIINGNKCSYKHIERTFLKYSLFIYLFIYGFNGAFFSKSDYMASNEGMIS